MRRASRVLSRILQIIPTLILIIVAAFVLVRLLPGDPAAPCSATGRPTPPSRGSTPQLGLDRPILVQFVALPRVRLAHGDLGTSIVLKVPVASLIAERLPVTLLLTALAAADRDPARRAARLRGGAATRPAGRTS